MKQLAIAKSTPIEKLTPIPSQKAVWRNRAGNVPGTWLSLNSRDREARLPLKVSPGFGGWVSARKLDDIEICKSTRIVTRGKME